MHNRKIVSVEVFPVGLPIIATFKFASGTAGKAGGRGTIILVKITDSEGEIGWGDCRPLPHWSYETAESVVTTIRNYFGPAIQGLSIWDRAGLHRALHTVVGRGPSTGQPIAKAAIDHALHDLCARAGGLPLRALLGGSATPVELELSWTCTAHDGAAMRADVARGKELGMRHFNFKAGVEPATDVEMAEIAAELAPPGAFLWADANQSLTLPDAVRLCEAYERIGVRLLEQPFPADRPGLMRSLRQRCKLPLAVDESCVSPADFLTYVREELVDYFVLKLTRSGGIVPSLQQMAIAEAAGLPMVVSGLSDGLLTKLAACQVAAAAGCKGPVAMNGSQFIDESALYPQKAEVERGGLVFLPSTPGVGMHPHEPAIQEFLLKDL